MKLIIGFIFLNALLLSEIASAQIYQLDSSISVRDDNTDFVSDDDVTGFVSRGTEFKVVSEKTLRSGAKALKVEFTKLGKGSRLDKDDQGPFYIYKRKNKEFKVLNNNSTTEASTTCSDGSCGGAAAPKQNAVETSREFLRRLEEDVEKKADAEALKKAPHSTDELKALVDRYSNSKTVDRMVNWAVRNIQATRGRGKCYRKVKETLSKNKMSKGRPILGAYARNAVPNLKEHGYINLMESPYSMSFTPQTAPKGAVLVYDSARDCDRGNRIVTMGKGCGHIEIKLGNGLYSSDYKSTSAITQTGIGRHYRLKAVMIKPDVD